MTTALVSVLGAAVLIAALMVFIRRRLSRAMEEVTLVYPEYSRLLTAPMANFFGLRSAGMKQVRGNGILLLTADRLYFRMLLPRRELTIPLDAVTSAGTVGSFLGRTKGRDLLEVDFTDEGGSEDSAAWLVGDLQEWVNGIRRSANLS
ncbi:MAG: hypothetical protein JXA64_00580 [Candidatus Fermentibacteraceae bacterium]|nr:hypothetical protein [Candidatus Fermentibacteraceae bacterium]MBN2607581.1 hypothetical protein [Candidatus Fermentibacteraceae bacterium]